MICKHYGSQQLCYHSSRRGYRCSSDPVDHTDCDLTLICDALIDKVARLFAQTFEVEDNSQRWSYAMTSNLDALATRVTTLEEQYQRLKSEVVTKKLIVVDSDGKPKASLGLADNGLPTLILFGADGQMCAVLRVTADGTALDLLASQTDTRLQLAVVEEGSDISLFDASGTRRAALNVLPPRHPALQELGIPKLVMNHPNGTSSVVLTVAGGRGGLNLADSANPDNAIRLQVDDSGPIIVCVRDNKVLFEAPLPPADTKLSPDERAAAAAAQVELRGLLPERLPGPQSRTLLGNNPRDPRPSTGHVPDASC